MISYKYVLSNIQKTYISLLHLCPLNNFNLFLFFIPFSLSTCSSLFKKSFIKFPISLNNKSQILLLYSIQMPHTMTKIDQKSTPNLVNKYFIEIEKETTNRNNSSSYIYTYPYPLLKQSFNNHRIIYLYLTFSTNTNICFCRSLSIYSVDNYL